MCLKFNIEKFVSESITGRSESLFADDLLKFDEELKQEISGKAVLVIGGAGTIGSSYIRALLKYSPAKLIVVDISENGLTELVRDCRSRTEIQLPADFKAYPVNFNDVVFTKIFNVEGPFDIVANFAAHKHVRSEKDIYSIEAMIGNNVIQAKRLLELLLRNPPKHFFCVSTDKAANPVNVMGASKKLMEELILAYSEKMKISTARFANVAFSNGSLLAGFIDRVLKQQPLACPSDVKRFFVSPDESGQICLCACILGKSGEIFFPKLEDETMVKFADIVEPFLKKVGYELEICSSEEEAKYATNKIAEGKYPVYFFPSDTSGEKLYEEFYTDSEELDMDTFASFGVIKNADRKKIEDLSQIIDMLNKVFISEHAEKKDIVKVLGNIMPGFEHMETGRGLDEKM